MIFRSASQTLVTGVYRTGTEFVTQLMSGHPQLSASMYHVNASRFILGRYEPLSDRLDQALVDTAQRLAERYQLHLDVPLAAEEIRRRGVSWATLYDVLISALWLGGAKCHWAEKCQLVWRHIADFVSAMPNGRAILVIRDPRSVLASFKSYTYAPPPAYLGAVFNSLDAMAYAVRLQDELPEDRFLVVRYEDAAKDPSALSARIFGFLGLDPADAVLDRSSWRNEKGEPWVANSCFHDKAEFDVQASIDRWRHKLEAWEIAFTEYVCADHMEHFGYRPSGAAMDWRRSLAAILPDATMTAHLHNFIQTGQGIQAFPTDPLDRANWEENARQETV